MNGEEMTKWYLLRLDNAAQIGPPTRAFMVPCNACLWFLRNLGSVPLSDGYRCVFGRLILLFAAKAPVTSAIHPLGSASGCRSPSMSQMVQ